MKLRSALEGGGFALAVTVAISAVVILYIILRAIPGAADTAGVAHNKVINALAPAQLITAEVICLDPDIRAVRKLAPDRLQADLVKDVTTYTLTWGPDQQYVTIDDTRPGARPGRNAENVTNQPTLRDCLQKLYDSAQLVVGP